MWRRHPHKRNGRHDEAHRGDRGRDRADPEEQGDRVPHRPAQGAPRDAAQGPDHRGGEEAGLRGHRLRGAAHGARAGRAGGLPVGGQVLHPDEADVREVRRGRVRVHDADGDPGDDLLQGHEDPDGGPAGDHRGREGQPRQGAAGDRDGPHIGPAADRAGRDEVAADEAEDRVRAGGLRHQAQQAGAADPAHAAREGRHQPAEQPGAQAPQREPGHLRARRVQDLQRGRARAAGRRHRRRAHRRRRGQPRLHAGPLRRQQDRLHHRRGARPPQRAPQLGPHLMQARLEHGRAPGEDLDQTRHSPHLHPAPERRGGPGGARHHPDAQGQAHGRDLRPLDPPGPVGEDEVRDRLGEVDQTHGAEGWQGPRAL